MALTMTRTRTQTALAKLVEVLAQVNGELAFVRELMAEAPAHYEALQAREAQLERERGALCPRFGSSTRSWTLRRSTARRIGGRGAGRRHGRGWCAGTWPPLARPGMSLKTFLMRICGRRPPLLAGGAATRCERLGGLDVKSLKPTLPLTEAEKVERYRTGRFAEMSDAQAGL